MANEHLILKLISENQGKISVSLVAKSLKIENDYARFLLNQLLKKGLVKELQKRNWYGRSQGSFDSPALSKVEGSFLQACPERSRRAQDDIGKNKEKEKITQKPKKQIKKNPSTPPPSVGVAQGDKIKKLGLPRKQRKQSRNNKKIKQIKKHKPVKKRASQKQEIIKKIEKTTKKKVKKNPIKRNSSVKLSSGKKEVSPKKSIKIYKQAVKLQPKVASPLAKAVRTIVSSELGTSLTAPAEIQGNKIAGSMALAPLVTKFIPIEGLLNWKRKIEERFEVFKKMSKSNLVRLAIVSSALLTLLIIRKLFIYL